MARHSRQVLDSRRQALRRAQATEHGVRHLGRRSMIAVLLAGIGIIVASLFGGASPAFAHATLISSSPAADSTVASMPSSLTLIFDEPITIGATPVALDGPNGAMTVGAARLTHGRTAVQVSMPAGKTSGVYRVRWQAASEDGDVIDGSFSFAVGSSPVTLGASATSATRGATQTALFRGLLFAALALCAGEVAGKSLLRRAEAAPEPPRSWMMFAALAGVAAAVGLSLLQLGAGSLTDGLLSPSVAALATLPGLVSLGQAAGFALTAILVRMRRTAWAWVPLDE